MSWCALLACGRCGRVPRGAAYVEDVTVGQDRHAVVIKDRAVCGALLIDTHMLAVCVLFLCCR